MSPASCRGCGAPLAAAAKFCRECGTAVESTEPNARPAAAAAEERARSCPSCGAAAVGETGFCRSCGERLPGPASASDPQIAPDPEPVRPSGERRTDLPPPIAAERKRKSGRAGLVAVGFLVCIVVGAAVAGGAYLLTKDDGGGASTSTGSIFDDVVERSGGSDPISTDGTQGGDGAGGGGGGAGGGDSGEREREEDEASGSEELSELTPGRYIQAGSFRSPEGAQEEVDRLTDAGIAVEAIAAAEADELLPGFQVLIVGPLSGARQEKRALRRLEAAEVAGLGKDLTPSSAVSGPESAAGEWSGSVEQSYLRGSRRPSTYEVVFAIAADGEGGTIEYPGRECEGRLDLIEEPGYSLAYAETIEAGPCPPGGVWHLRPEGSELTAVRLHEDREVMVHGTLSAPAG